MGAELVCCGVLRGLFHELHRLHDVLSGDGIRARSRRGISCRKKYQEKRDKAHREIPTRVLVVLSIEYEIIADMMTKLYEDPANRAIGHRDICYVAINRLIGDTKEEMERALKQFRESNH